MSTESSVSTKEAFTAMKSQIRRLVLAEGLGVHRGPLLLLAFGSFFMIRSALDPQSVLDIFRNIGLFILIFSFVVGFHEFCHLGAARLLGIDGHAFVLGFGPKLFGHRAFGIDWGVRLLPIGGYVKLRGEDEADGPHSFAGTTARRKIIILLAGPASNIVLSLVLLAGISLYAGAPLARVPNIVFEILGIVISKTGEAIANFLPNAADTPLDMPIMGIPGMVAGVGTMLDIGPYMVVILAAVISFSMGIMNGLPIPPLDGGQALVAFLRHITGAHYPERVMAAFTRLAFAGLVLFMLSVNAIDTYRSIIGYTVAGQ